MLTNTDDQATATRGDAEGSEHAPTAAPGAGNPRSGGLSLTEGIRLARSLGTPVLNGPAWRDPQAKRDRAFQLECPDRSPAEELNWESDPYFPLKFRQRTITIRCDEAKRRAEAFGEGASARRTSAPGEDADSGTGSGEHLFAGPREGSPGPEFCGSCNRPVHSDDEVWCYGEAWHETCLEQVERDIDKELRRVPRRRR